MPQIIEINHSEIIASIIISFVGTQDPYSDRTNEEGSIVSLVKHLLAAQYENIHKLEGISQIYKSDLILNDLKSMLKQLTPVPDTNTFDQLNQDISNQLQLDL